jgi:DNA-binding beta-propeller fold protein YncE
MKQSIKAISLGLVAIAVLFFDSGFAHADTIYVSNRGNNTIMKFDSSGIGTVFADTGLNWPEGLAFDSSGNLYVANAGNNTIMKFDSSGNGSLFASSGLDNPYGLAFDSSGSLYVANKILTGSIMKYDSSGNGSVFANVALNDCLATRLEG